MNVRDIKTVLAKKQFDFSELPVHLSAFCTFMSPWLRGDGFENSKGSPVTYKETAARGYRLAANDSFSDDVEKFKDEIHQLAGRKYFSEGRVPIFEIDGIALLGISLGYKFITEELEDVGWFTDLLDKSLRALKNDHWQYGLTQLAKSMVADDNLDSENAILDVGLSAALNNNIPKEKLNNAWDILISDFGETELTKVAVLQRVFDVCAAALARMPINGAGLPELIEVLEGVSQSMSHWTYEDKQRVRNVTPQKWEMDHEYHVQNLLWTILRPIFSDLVDEESLKKLGHTSPRYDLGIPSLHTIIEVKYLRKSGQPALKKITDEVAADRSLYLRDGTNYSKMVVFIWDEARQTEEYKTLQNGLESLSGIEKVIILPRPSRMERIIN